MASCHQAYERSRSSSAPGASPGTLAGQCRSSNMSASSGTDPSPKNVLAQGVKAADRDVHQPPAQRGDQGCVAGRFGVLQAAIIGRFDVEAVSDRSPRVLVVGQPLEPRPQMDVPVENSIWPTSCGPHSTRPSSRRPPPFGQANVHLSHRSLGSSPDPDDLVSRDPVEVPGRGPPLGAVYGAVNTSPATSAGQPPCG